MKTPIRACLTGAACLLASLQIADAATNFNTPADVAAITAMENDLNTQTSMKGLIKYYAPDATVVDIFAPGIYHGTAQIYPAFEKQFASLGSMTHHMDQIDIASDGKFARAAMRITFHSIMKNGAKVVLSVRQIDAMKKFGDSWKVIQQHVSLPIDAKTGMAVMDGTLPAAAGPLPWDADPFPAAEVSPEQSKAEIRHWMDVGTLSTSIDQMMAYYGPGEAALEYDDYFPGEMRGKAAIARYYAPMMGSFDSIKVKIPMFVADSDGSFGVQIDNQDMKLHMKDGSTKYISIRQSDCMHRISGKWYSFFELVSFPIVAQTGKAITENPAAFQ